MDFKGQSIISTKQFDKDSLLELFELAKKMEEILDNGGRKDLLHGKILATLFFEPSTRTRFSFETAMLRLGGKVISNADMMSTSSLKKRETLEDTGKVLSQMADIIAMRHPEAGSVAKLASKSDVPVINGGDGSAEHPTQGLLDVYTIWKEFGKFDGLTIGVYGDLKYGRAPHSHCDLLSNFDTKFIFVSPEALKYPPEIVEEFKQGGHGVIETEDLKSVIGDMDVVSCTRVQEERFETKEEYEKYAGVYVLDKELAEKVKKDAIIIHPLPRVDEIAVEVDSDPRVKYFEQVRNGVAIRMALMLMVLGVDYK